MNFDPNNFKTYLIWDYISGYAVGLISVTHCLFVGSRFNETVQAILTESSANSCYKTVNSLFSYFSFIYSSLKKVLFSNLDYFSSKIL